MRREARDRRRRRSRSSSPPRWPSRPAAEAAATTRATRSRRATRAPAREEPSASVTLWIMNNGPKPVADMEKIVAPFDAEDRHQGQGRARRLGRPVRPHPQRGRLGRGPGRHAGGHHAGAVLRRARRLRGPQRQGRATSAASPRYAPGIWNTTQVDGQDGTWALPWFTEARAIYYRKDVLKKAGVDPGDGVQGLGRVPQATLEKRSRTSSDRRQAHPAVRRAGQEGVRPRPQRDAVRVGRRRRRALAPTTRSRRSTRRRPQQGVKFMADLIKDGLFDKSQLERDGTQVENQFKGGRLAVWIGGPWVLGSIAARRRRHLARPRARTSASRRCRPGPTARRSRSSAART